MELNNRMLTLFAITTLGMGCLGAPEAKEEAGASTSQKIEVMTTSGEKIQVDSSDLCDNTRKRVPEGYRVEPDPVNKTFRLVPMDGTVHENAVQFSITCECSSFKEEGGGSCSAVYDQNLKEYVCKKNGCSGCIS